MEVSNSSITFKSNSYELVGRRIQRMVSDPGVQKVQAVTVVKREDESPDAWERVLQELDETVGITVERIDAVSVTIGWSKYVDL
ncbi:DUF1654 domain-containing protein [Pseudomonas putida]|uniref:DUF1654 domain-containing protein n=1 Tax=Pseudomonas putida TaxID=303 RepID=UPI003D999FF1